MDGWRDWFCCFLFFVGYGPQRAQCSAKRRQTNKQNQLNSFKSIKTKQRERRWSEPIQRSKLNFNFIWFVNGVDRLHQAGHQGSSSCRGKPNNSSLLLSARASAVKKKKRLLLVGCAIALPLHQQMKHFQFVDWSEPRGKKRNEAQSISSFFELNEDWWVSLFFPLIVFSRGASISLLKESKPISLFHHSHKWMIEEEKRLFCLLSPPAAIHSIQKCFDWMKAEEGRRS